MSFNVFIRVCFVSFLKVSHFFEFQIDLLLILLGIDYELETPMNAPNEVLYCSDSYLILSYLILSYLIFE